MCLREQELEKRQRLEKFGATAVFDEGCNKVIKTYGAIGDTAQAYLNTLLPTSD